MAAGHELIERGIPDLIESGHLEPVVAAEIDFLAGRFREWTGRGSPTLRARAAAAAGDEADATALLGEVDLSSCDVHELTAAAWAVSRVGPRSMAESLVDALREQPTFLFAGDVPLGPRSLVEGPLLAAIGNLPDAIGRLEDAVAIGDVRAPLWGALARVELARVMLCAEVVGDAGPPASGPSPDRLLTAAALFFRAGGYRSLLERTGHLTHPDGHAPTLGAPTVGRLRPGPVWRIGFGVMGDVTQRGGKGLTMIRHLVQNPGRPIPAIVLDRVAKGGAVDAVEPRPDAGIEEIRAQWYDEAVRSRVGKLLSRTISGIADQHPLLAGHLRATVRTGHACRYDPSGSRVVVWVT